MTNSYEALLDMPHPEPRHHVRMSLQARAAQFAPYAALTGMESLMDETERFIDEKLELDEEEKGQINMMLSKLAEATERITCTVSYFEKDLSKKGGRYCLYTGCVRKVDLYSNEIVFVDRFKIAFEDIYAITINE